ncbi:NUDIX hydrolase [Actinophytocola sp.]|uniref:NUDIX hydrolase n=1 Tax=Actinophytocola sp. TaxID=1872138 RepID=UPI002ED0BABB
MVKRQPATIHYTADVVLLAPVDNRLSVLLVERAHEPYAGKWALPGGHVDSWIGNGGKLNGETSREAARRELREETGINIKAHDLMEVGAYDEIGRDPRGHYVTMVYAAMLDAPAEPTPGTDASRVAWHPALDTPDLAFDHAAILHDLIGGMIAKPVVTRRRRTA